MLTLLCLESSVLGTNGISPWKMNFSSLSPPLQYLQHHPYNIYAYLHPLQSSCLVTLVTLAFSIYVTLLYICKFCSQLRYMVYHNCFSLLAHIFVFPEFKHPQDSEKPKEESQQQLEWLWSACHGE